VVIGVGTRATQASPPFSTPPPPLREGWVWSRRRDEGDGRIGVVEEGGSRSYGGRYLTNVGVLCYNGAR